MGAWVYILRCADGSYYTGSSRDTTPERRLSEHQDGVNPDAYTFIRRPVELVYTQFFERIADAVAAERQMKGWSRAKKEALIRGDFGSLTWLAKRPTARKGQAKPSS